MHSPDDALPSLSRSVAGRVAIITGAASGMGRATALLLAAEGARVVVADRNTEGVQRVVAEIAEHYGPDLALGVPCDVAERADLQRVVNETVAWAGRLDIVVNNAGTSRRNSTVQDEDEFEAAWQHVLDVNLTAQIRLVRFALPHLLESDAGRVVNISSTEAMITQRGVLSYSASKAGIVGLTKALAVDLGYHGITVNCICPGPVDTPMTRVAYDPQVQAAYAKARTAVRRYGLPEEVAQMTLNLCLPASSFTTGAIIPVDGGLTARHT